MEVAFTGELGNVTNCAKAANLDFSTLQQCATTSKGHELLIEAGQRTGPHTYVPWVQINGEHSTDAENDLLKTVCETFTKMGAKDAPAACSKAVDREIIVDK